MTEEKSNPSKYDLRSLRYISGSNNLYILATLVSLPAIPFVSCHGGSTVPNVPLAKSIADVDLGDPLVRDACDVPLSSNIISGETMTLHSIVYNLDSLVCGCLYFR